MLQFFLIGTLIIAGIIGTASYLGPRKPSVLCKVIDKNGSPTWEVCSKDKE